MKTAAVVLNYNDADETICQCERILKMPVIDEIVIVDNASTDDSYEKLAEFISHTKTMSIAKKNNPKQIMQKEIYLLKSDKNGGYGYGNNKGIHYAIEKLDCTHIVIANPDAVFDEETVKKMLEAFKNDCQIGVTGAVKSHQTLDAKQTMKSKDQFSDAPETALIKNVKQTTESKDQFSDAPETALIKNVKQTTDSMGTWMDGAENNHECEQKTGSENYCGKHNNLTESGWKKRTFLEEILYSGPILKRLFKGTINYPKEYYASCPQVSVYAVHGSLLMVSAEAFLKSGGYDENVFLYKEEDILGCRMEKAMYKTVLLTETFYYHKGSHSIEGSGMDDVRRQKERQKSELYYYRYYLNANAAKLLLARLVQAVVLFETKLWEMIVNLRTKKTKMRK